MTVPAGNGLVRRVVSQFLGGHNGALVLISALGLGVAAVLVTPREEEPQIVVPVADVFVEAPGYSAKEVERLVATPLSRLLWQLTGVEHVQAVSRRDQAVITVQFYVGEDREDSIILLRNQIQSHLDELPPIVATWLVRPIEIDDVPIVTLTLSGEGFDLYELRRVAEEARARLDSLPELSRTQVVGGAPREVRVELDRERLEGHDLTVLEVADTIQRRGLSSVAGALNRLNTHIVVDVGNGFRSAEELADLEVAVRNGAPVRLREVAEVLDGPGELTSYTRLATGRAHPAGAAESVPAVTIAAAKQRGTDATRVADRILEEVERLRTEVLPEGLDVTVTRNYGQTADRKVNELLESIGFALLTVVALLFFTLGWREALVVAVAVPVSFSLALVVNLALGYTINRVTLFALILALGLVVDDPIANVDNIERHLRLGKGSASQRVLDAVSEVLPPVIMSTLTIIVSFLPMFFITGMMGPYMEPMAANVPLAVAFSTLAALTVVPWLAHRLLKNRMRTSPEGAESRSKRPVRLARMYRATMDRILRNRWTAWSVLGAVVVLFVGANALPVLGMVPLKMLPFDDRNELQIMVDLPAGSTLESTDAAVREMERFLVAQPDVETVQSYVGTPSPMDFNGLIRHTYLRDSGELADIRINLIDKEQRRSQSHSIGLRIRDDLTRIADRHGALLRLVEVPPGPPVMATLVAEVYGNDDTPHEELVAAGRRLAEIMKAQPGVREVDVLAPEPHERLHFTLDQRQAAIHGLDETQAAGLLALALGGQDASTLRDASERQPLAIRLRLPSHQRSDAAALGLLSARTASGSQMALSEVGHFESAQAEPVTYQKDLRPVVFVTAEAVGIPPAEAILALSNELPAGALGTGIDVEWAGEGEWDITLRVFRDLGIAFGAALILIYLLLVVETRSLSMPVLVMMAIPLTAIGIMPGFWLLNALVASEVGGYPDPIFFTATAMIGMIALGGIVVRNSLVLIEFIETSVTAGTGLKDAIFESGAVRMRPILLTAGTTALGAWPITLDPIFSGLAWALIFGLVASTLFTLIVVPTAFYLLRQNLLATQAA